MKQLSILALLLFSLTNFSQENKPTTLDSIQQIDEVHIQSSVLFGNKLVAQNRTGSAYYISSTELKKMGYIDINRVLKTVPGVTIVEEEGFGLRPNISLRGTSPERSAKITLMEDGVLIAPAPYSASSAYYFPSLLRMQAVEILKGSSQIQYGPFTTGGAINMVSTQIPNSFEGRVKASYGSFNSSQLYASMGDSKDHFGYSIEYLNFNSNGFKELNDFNTGFDKNDLVAKFQLNSSKEATVRQSLQLKFQYSNELSHETYLGLTETDFETSPFQRYLSSQEDQMDNEHLQFMVTHQLDINNDFRWSTTAYYNDFYRNWYKLNDVTVDESKVNIASILEDPDSYPQHFGYITGDFNTLDGVLGVKANNRNYLSKGIQTKLDFHFYTGTLFHDLELGARYHYDEEDRFQWVDLYNINDGIMNLTNEGIPGTDANRISSAVAFSSYLLYKLKLKNLTLTPGVRYENISLQREDYGKEDIYRLGDELSIRENKVDIFIPGVGFNYKFNNDLSVFGGVHKGFSPPGNQPGVLSEESINYELGWRFRLNSLSGEIVGFHNNYSNLLGSDLAASGGTGTLDQFNAGEALVEGIEALINYTFFETSSNFRVPLTLGYTYTDTEFQNNFNSEDGIWGIITKGDEIPYIAKHQLNASLGITLSKLDINFNGRYNGAFRTMAGSGDIPENEKVNSNIVLDLSTNYKISKFLSINGNIINLLNNTYAVSRAPAGLRPGHPFGVYAGLEFTF